MPDNTVTIGITGRVDPSFTTAVDAAKRQMASLSSGDKAKPLVPKIDVSALDRQIATIQNRLNTLQFKALKGGISADDMRSFETLRRELARLQSVKLNIPVDTHNARLRIIELQQDIDKLRAKMAAGTITIGETGQLKQMQAELAKLQNTRVRVDADTTQAKARIAELQQQIAALQGKVSSGKITVGELQGLQRAQSELKQLQAVMGETKAVAEKASGGFSLLGRSIGMAALAAGAFKLAKLTAELGQLGAKADTVSRIFTNLARANDVNAESLLAGMQAASRGTMDQLSIMQIANRAMMAGGAQLANDL